MPKSQEQYTITERGIGYLQGFEAAVEEIRQLKTISEVKLWIAECDAIKKLGQR